MEPDLRLLVLTCAALVAAGAVVDAAPSRRGRDQVPETQRDPQGPSISATRKPPCPSYIQCPYPEYPRPTTKSTTQVDVVKTTTPLPSKLPEESPIVDYFGAEKPEAKPEGNEKPPSNAGDSGGRPAVSATQKPPCPSFIQCPYPEYPRPTTKGTTEVVSTPTTSTTIAPSVGPEEKPLVEYFGPEPSESVGGTQTDSQPDKPDKEPNDADKPTGDNADSLSGSRPAVSATQKPPCPSFIQCPYPEYPRPTTKGTTTVDNISSATPSPSKDPEIKPVVEYFGPESSGNSEAELKPDDNTASGDSGSKPAISATQKPNCPSYIQCPYPEYPRPTTKGTTEVDKIGSSTPVSIPVSSQISNEPSPPSNNQLLAEYILGLENSGSGESSSPSEVASETAGLSNFDKPAVSATQKPPCPSYITCPYPEYPRPTTKRTTEVDAMPSSLTNQPQESVADVLQEETTTFATTLAETGEKLETITNVDKSSDSPSLPWRPNTDYPFYLQGPWVYPRPTTKNPYQHIRQTTQKPFVEFFEAAPGKNEVGSSSPNPARLPPRPPGDIHFPGPTQTKSAVSTMDTTTADTVVERFSTESSNTFLQTNLPEESSNSVTQKPTCPPYISCSHEYPNPPGNNLPGSKISPIIQNPIDLANQGAFLPIYTYLYGIDNYWYRKQPSIPLTYGPFWPSYLSNPSSSDDNGGDFYNQEQLNIAEGNRH